MQTTTVVVLSCLSLVVLAMISTLFNRYVEQRPLIRRADGETALWVVAGCTYAVAGAAALLGVWGQWLKSDWRLGFWALLAMSMSFGAAGAPMFFGDLRRTQAWRETNQYLERAERANGGRR